MINDKLGRLTVRSISECEEVKNSKIASKDEVTGEPIKCRGKLV